MIRWFQCPDGDKIDCEECLKEGGCRMVAEGKREFRCMSRPTLKMMFQRRPIYPKKIGTTRLLNGTMQAYLMNKIDYAEDPQKMAFMIQGTKQHKELERFGDDISVAEGKYDDEENTIRPDLLETENGRMILYDYKMSGSFQVAKALGIYKEDEPVLDEDGEQVLYKTGKKKGKPKTKQAIKRDPLRADVRDWALQLNNYRIGVEKKLKVKIKDLLVEVVVRDGNTIASMSRGVNQNIEIIPVPVLPDKEVKAYFTRKRNALRKALKQDYWDIPCNDEERWGNDFKCQKYCPVNDHCPYYIEHYKKQIEVTDADTDECEEIEYDDDDMEEIS